MSGASAAPSALLGDQLSVNRAAYRLFLPYTGVALCRTGIPKRGDLVGVRPAGRADLIFKRVMGLPGETIEMRENRVLIDGSPLALEPLARADFYWVPPVHRIGPFVWNEAGHFVAFAPAVSPHGTFPPLTLAADRYFVLGDNRDNSVDSRQWGPVSGEEILGKVVAVWRTGPRQRAVAAVPFRIVP